MPIDDSQLLHHEESYRILGACFEVYKEKGCGFSEPLYHECLQIECEMQGIPAIHEPRLELEYKGRKLLQSFVPDFLMFGKIVVELKAVTRLADEHRAQVMNYLKATRLQLGFVVNFGHHPKVEYSRLLAHDHWTSNEVPDLRA